MKNLFIMLAFIVLATKTWADEQPVKAEIKDVVVFRSGAQINMQGTAQIKKGRTELVFSGLAMQLNPNSIQLTGKGSFTVLSVYHRLNYVEKTKMSSRIKEMEDSIKMWQKKNAYIDNDMKTLAEEAQMLRDNRQISGEQNGVKVTELAAMADFYRNRFKEINDKTLSYSYQKNDIAEYIFNLNNRLNQLRSTKTEALSEIVAEVMAEEPVSASLFLSYVVYQAGWTPEYDIRAVDVKSPVELHLRAMVFQNTGIDWQNVNLTISTGNPSENGIIPVLPTWYLYHQLINQKSRSLKVASIETENKNYQNAELDDVAVLSKASVVASNSNYAMNTSNYTVMQQAQTNVKYEISIPYNIPSSSKTVNVKIQKYKLNSTYRYYCVPKLDDNVYLQARVVGWEDLSLVPGYVNVFFEGTYVTKSYLDPAVFIDTLDISLGNDKSISVKREKIKDKASTSLIGGVKKETTAWEISIRNSKAENVQLVIEDQIPLSRVKEIEVELTSSDGAKLVPETGILTWESEVKAKESKKIKFSYQIKYPDKYYITNKE